MKFIVTMKDGAKHEVNAYSFEPTEGVVTFMNDTRTPVAAFSGWAAVQPAPEAA